MRVLLWHGWTLEGSGSNVYTARTAEILRAGGHDVVLVCQEPHPERLPFVDAWGSVDGERVSPLTAAAVPPGAGRLVLLRPDIGSLLPVFVVDRYEGFAVKRFVDLDDGELATYLRRNRGALEAAVAWRRPDVVIAGHAIPGAVIAARALAARGIPYVAKVHGSDLEYAIRRQPRYRELAREGLGGAVAVVGGTRDVLRRTAELVPGVSRNTVVVPPGVEVDRFRPIPGATALRAAADSLADAGFDGAGPGRPSSLDERVGRALAERDGAELDRLAAAYDQQAPDPGAAARLRALAAATEPVVGYLGKFIPQKGVQDLIAALPLLRTPVRTVLVGFGTFREWLEALVLATRTGDRVSLGWLLDRWPVPLEVDADAVAKDAVGNAGRVAFTGRLDHRFAPSVLAACDVLVVPSILDEAFGMVAAEAAAAGALPLVARHSGLAEIADALEGFARRPGLFSYQPGDGAPAGIAEGLARLLALPDGERLELRELVSAHVRRRWTWERTAERLLDAAAAGSAPFQ